MKTLTPRQVAAICHAAKREYKRQIGEDLAPEFHELPPDAQQRLIDSTIRAVKDPLRPVADRHDEWCRIMRERGYTQGQPIDGKVEDRYRKIHAHLLPYDELPDDVRMKARFMPAMVRLLRTLIRVE